MSMKADATFLFKSVKICDAAYETIKRLLEYKAQNEGSTTNTVQTLQQQDVTPKNLDIIISRSTDKKATASEGDLMSSTFELKQSMGDKDTGGVGTAAVSQIVEKKDEEDGDGTVPSDTVPSDLNSSHDSKQKNQGVAMMFQKVEAGKDVPIKDDLQGDEVKMGVAASMEEIQDGKQLESMGGDEMQDLIAKQAASVQEQTDKELLEYDFKGKNFSKQFLGKRVPISELDDSNDKILAELN